MPDRDEPFAHAADKPRTQPSPDRVRVNELIRKGREVILVHNGQDYRLRITAAGKLILTK